MVLAGRSNLRVSKYFFSGRHFFVFVEYLCKRSPKIKTKNIKNYSSILAIVNHRNWLDDSPPLVLKIIGLFLALETKMLENNDISINDVMLEWDFNAVDNAKTIFQIDAFAVVSSCRGLVLIVFPRAKKLIFERV